MQSLCLHTHTDTCTFARNTMHACFHYNTASWPSCTCSQSIPQIQANLTTAVTSLLPCFEEELLLMETCTGAFVRRPLLICTPCEEMGLLRLATQKFCFIAALSRTRNLKIGSTRFYWHTKRFRSISHTVMKKNHLS